MLQEVDRFAYALGNKRGSDLPALPPARILSNVRLLNAGPIPLAQLMQAGDQDLEDALRSPSLGVLEPSKTFYRLVDVEVARFGAFDPESFMMDGDEDGYERALNLADAYRNEDLSAIAPLVIRCGEVDNPEIIDGWHRLAGASEVNRTYVRCYELLSDV